MILVSASDCLQHKFGSNCLNGGNLNVGTVEVQLDSIADTKLLALRTIDCKTVVFFSKSVKNSVKRGVRVLRARSASLTRVFSVSPRSRSLFSALFETFCLTARAYLNRQKYGLFCSLSELKRAWNLAFPVFISPIIWNMCENLNYEESVDFKELHNDQE